MFPYTGLWTRYSSINNNTAFHLNPLTGKSILVKLNGLVIGTFGMPSSHGKVEAISYQKKAILIFVKGKVNVSEFQ